MRTRMLALLAALLACTGTALIVVPTADATEPPPWFGLCTTAAEKSCIESATADGVATVPGPNGVARDVVLVGYDGNGTLAFSVQHDDGTGALTRGIAPNVTYRIVVRSSLVAPRQVSGHLKDPRFTTDSYGRRFTLEFKPTQAHYVAPGACTVTACGNSATKATTEYDAVADGTVSDLTTSGVSAVDANDRTGIAEATSAQILASRHNYHLNNYVVTLANPFRHADNSVNLDVDYQAFFPDWYLQTRFEVANPANLTRASVNITRTVAGKQQGVNAAVFHENGGIRIRISMIPGTVQTLRIHPKPGRPGKAWVGSPVKQTKTSVRVGVHAPWATGGSPITSYQARCRVTGTRKWHYGTSRTTAKLVVKKLPAWAVDSYRVACQARAHNRYGYGAFSDLERM